MTDKENQYIYAIEKLNMEYLEQINNVSSEYQIGYKILLVKKNFPFKLWRLYKNHRKWAKIDKKVAKLSKEFNEKLYWNDGEKLEGTKGVLYTCITGTYDKLFDPMLCIDGLEYVAFTDNPLLKKGKWKIWHIEKMEGASKNYTNRYYKMHSTEFFKKEDYAIYVDGNVQVVSDVSTLYALAKNSKTGIAMHKHAERDCIFAEGQACIYHGRGNKKQIIAQLKSYKNHGMPEHFGMLEATIIVIDLHNTIAKKLMEDWWEQFSYWNSGRDQLAFSYVLWNNGYTLDDVGILGNNKFMNPKFRIGGHAEWRI